MNANKSSNCSNKLIITIKNNYYNKKMTYVTKDVKKYIKKEKTLCGHTAKVYKGKDGKLKGIWKVDDGKYMTSDWPQNAGIFGLLFGAHCPSKPTTCGYKCRRRLQKTKKAKRS